MTRSGWAITCVLFVVLAAFTSGCAGWAKPEVSGRNRQEALARMDRLLARNAALTPYKGIGRMWFFDSEGAWSSRGAWVGEPPGRFRVEALAMTGQPLARLICDDRACHFVYFEDGCFKSLKSGERNLKLLTGVAVDIGDLVLLLGGGVPVYPHDAAWIEPEETGGGDVLVLRKRWVGIVEKLFFAPGGKRVVRIETYGLLGLRYRVEMDPGQAEPSDALPRFLRIVNEEGSGLQIDVERGWAAAELPADVFVPKTPEGRRCD